MPFLSYLVDFDFNYKAEVTKIFDGDTVEVKFGPFRERLRLALIDAPEKGQPFVTGLGDAGLVSKNCLAKILGKKKEFDLKIHSRDMYGRLLGELSGVSYEFIKNGCGGLYPYASFSSFKEKNQFIRLLDEAKKMRRGLWSYGGYMRPYFWRKLKKRTFQGKLKSGPKKGLNRRKIQEL